MQIGTIGRRLREGAAASAIGVLNETARWTSQLGRAWGTHRGGIGVRGVGRGGSAVARAGRRRAGTASGREAGCGERVLTGPYARGRHVPLASAGQATHPERPGVASARCLTSCRSLQGSEARARRFARGSSTPRRRGRRGARAGALRRHRMSPWNPRRLRLRPSGVPGRARASSSRSRGPEGRSA
jgi:hypothetical protein